MHRSEDVPVSVLVIVFNRRQLFVLLLVLIVELIFK